MPSKSRTGAPRRKGDQVEESLSLEEFDSPRFLNLRGQQVAITGKFEFGTQEEVLQATRDAGGRGEITDRVGPNTDIIVVGSRRSPVYKFDTHGVHWAEALKRRRLTGKPLIVDEAVWRDALQPIETPRCTTIEEEMASLGVPDSVSEQAYRMAREDLVAGRIDAYEVAVVARRYDRTLRAR